MFCKYIPMFMLFTGIALIAGISATVSKDMDFGVVHYEEPYNGEIQLGTDSKANLSNGASGLSLIGIHLRVMFL